MKVPALDILYWSPIVGVEPMLVVDRVLQSPRQAADDVIARCRELGVATPALRLWGAVSGLDLCDVTRALRSGITLDAETGWYLRFYRSLLAAGITPRYIVADHEELWGRWSSPVLYPSSGGNRLTPFGGRAVAVSFLDAVNALAACVAGGLPVAPWFSMPGYGVGPAMTLSQGERYYAEIHTIAWLLGVSCFLEWNPRDWSGEHSDARWSADVETRAVAHVRSLADLLPLPPRHRPKSPLPADTREIVLGDYRFGLDLLETA